MNLLNPPTVHIDHVENFYGIDDYLNHSLPGRVLDLTFPCTNSRSKSKSNSKRRAIKRKLKKIVRKAVKVYEEMVEEEFSLDDTCYDQEM